LARLGGSTGRNYGRMRCRKRCRSTRRRHLLGRSRRDACRRRHSRMLAWHHRLQVGRRHPYLDTGRVANQDPTSLPLPYARNWIPRHETHPLVRAKVQSHVHALILDDVDSRCFAPSPSSSSSTTPSGPRGRHCGVERSPPLRAQKIKHITDLCHAMPLFTFC